MTAELLVTLLAATLLITWPEADAEPTPASKAIAMPKFAARNFALRWTFALSAVSRWPTLVSIHQGLICLQ
jgi:hypothetical protein